MTLDAAHDQQRVATELGVQPTIDPAREAETRTRFLTELLASSGARALVLGISGGVDSAAAGALCRRAVDRVAGARFVAVRLPYGRQRDDDDARLVLDAIRPDLVRTVDVQPGSDAVLTSLVGAGVGLGDETRRDFILGNIKARQRMVVQYAIAGALGGLVIGTDHAAEAVTGFFTKYGDGGVDAVPLAGLTKRQVRALAAHLNVPDRIVTKVPTADLETLAPGRPDEEALGLTYEQIDNYLEGRPVPPQVHDAVLAIYLRTAHKRRLPVAPTAG